MTEKNDEEIIEQEMQKVILNYLTDLKDSADGHLRTCQKKNCEECKELAIKMDVYLNIQKQIREKILKRGLKNDRKK